MSEPTPQDDILTEHIPVRKNYITPKFRNGRFVATNFPGPNELPPLRQQMNSDEKERQLLEMTKEPTPTLAQGLHMARNIVNNLRKRYGLPIVPHETMQIALLDKNNYNRACEIASYDQHIDTSGLTLPYIDPVLVEYDETKPEYFTAGIAVHELVHRWLEFDAWVYSATQNIDEKTKENYPYRLHIEPRRSGLRVTKTKLKNDQIIDQGRVGALLNELPNIAVQDAYVTRVLEEKPEPFKEEVERREQLLRQFMRDLGRPEDTERIKVVLSEGQYQVVLEDSHMHFDTEGNPLFLDGQKNFLPYAEQLIVDLSRVCGEKGQPAVSELLLEAKIAPDLQGQIKRRVDDRMGSGFYNKLRHAEYEPDDVAQLLTAVQSKIYPH